MNLAQASAVEGDRLDDRIDGASRHQTETINRETRDSRETRDFHESRVIYAGKHTITGSVLGAAVRDAVARGIARWIAEVGCRGK